MPYIFMLIFNLTTGQATVQQMDSMQHCEKSKEHVLKTMHLSAKDGAVYNAICIESDAFTAKRVAM